MTQGPNGTYATRDQILAIDDLRYEDVYVEAWDFSVRVRELTGTERGDFEKSISHVTTKADGTTSVEFDAHRLRVQLCALTMVDGDGNRLFDDHQGVEELGRKSAKALQDIFEVSSKLSGISEDSAEDAVEKSDAVPSEESSSDSA